MSALLPERRVLVGAVKLTVPVVLACVIAVVLGGPLALMGVTIGVVASVAVSVTDVGWGTRAAVVGGAGVAAGVGMVVVGHPWLVAFLVAAAGLAQAPLSRRSAGIASMLPVAAAVGASVPVSGDVLALAAWVLVGGCAVVTVFSLSGQAVASVPVVSAVAWRHGIVTAVAVGVAAYLIVRFEVDHGYWLILTLAVVLRPVRGDTVEGARDRAVGTVLGVVVAVAVAVTLPWWVAAALAVVCLLLSTAWGLMGQLRQQALFTTPAVILITSSGAVDEAVALAVDRILLTFAGALMASLAALLLANWQHTRLPDA